VEKNSLSSLPPSLTHSLSLCLRVWVLLEKKQMKKWRRQTNTREHVVVVVVVVVVVSDRVDR